MRNQKGFGFVEIIIIIVVIAVVGLVGWYVWTASTKNQSTNQSNSPDKSNTSSSKTINLVSDHVTFTLPTGWSEGQMDGDGCMGTLGGAVTCLDQTIISPNDAGVVNGAPAYSVTVAAYKHDDATTAKTWWENDYQGDNGTSVVSGKIVGPSTANISGYDAYTFTLESDNGSSTIRYVIVSKNYVILVAAVVKDPAPSNGGQAHDYSKYLPAIKTFVESTKI